MKPVSLDLSPFSTFFSLKVSFTDYRRRPHLDLSLQSRRSEYWQKSCTCSVISFSIRKCTSDLREPVYVVNYCKNMGVQGRWVYSMNTSIRVSCLSMSLWPRFKVRYKLYVNFYIQLKRFKRCKDGIKSPTKIFHVVKFKFLPKWIFIQL